MIIKLVGHLGVDTLFRRAFPEMMILDLQLDGIARWDPRYDALGCEVFGITGDTGDTLMGGVALGWSLKKRGIFAPDLFIVDSPLSVFVATLTQARRMVWYCHGDFTREANPWAGFQRHAMSLMGNAPSIYPTRAKRAANASWRPPHRSIVVPLAVPEEAFVPPVPRNGRICVARNNIPDRLKLYDAERFTALFQELMTERVDVFGYNDPHPLFGPARLKGFVPIRELACYAAGMEPFGNPSPSLCQLEVMAAGVPMVTFPREDFEDRSSDAYLLAETADEFRRQLEVAVQHPEIGLRGQEYIRCRFSVAAWCNAVRAFVGEEMR